MDDFSLSFKEKCRSDVAQTSERFHLGKKSPCSSFSMRLCVYVEESCSHHVPLKDTAHLVPYPPENRGNEASFNVTFFEAKTTHNSEF